MEKHIVILGASIAGINVMNTLVKHHYKGKITLIDEKETYPYNPYKLSKDWMMDLEKVNPPLLKKKSYYEENQIDLKLNTKAISFDPKKKALTLSDNQMIAYDILVIATGSKLNQFLVEANNLLYLRTYTDALEIKEKIKEAKHITLIGGGFISLELAASFRQLGKEVSVIVRDKKPLLKNFGSFFADYILQMHKEKGVHFIVEDEVVQWNIEKQEIKSVLTKKGQKIHSDHVIAGLGVKPNVSVTHESLTLDGGIVVDAYHQTSLKDVYAAGDVSVFPYRNQMIHVDHWEVAYTSGINIAQNILSNNQTPYDFVPYFWTDQYDETFEYLGYAKDVVSIEVEKGKEKNQFVIKYLNEKQQVVAILFANHALSRDEAQSMLK